MPAGWPRGWTRKQVELRDRIAYGIQDRQRRGEEVLTKGGNPVRDPFNAATMTVKRLRKEGRV